LNTAAEFKDVPLTRAARKNSVRFRFFQKLPTGWKLLGDSGLAIPGGALRQTPPKRNSSAAAPGDRLKNYTVTARRGNVPVRRLLLLFHNRNAESRLW